MTVTIITGATGFLGGAVARRLLGDGERVVAIGRNQEKLDALARLGAETRALDLTGNAASSALPTASHFVHCAALSSPWGTPRQFAAANVDGTVRAMNLARAAGVRRFVHISSPSIYFRFADQDWVPEESSLPKPVNAYAATKAESERHVLAEPSLDPVILRPRGLYGPGDMALLPRLLRAARQRPLPLMRNGVAATDLTYIDDVVEAVLAAIRVPSPASRVFNISGGEAIPIRHVAEQAARAAGIPVRWRPMAWPVVRAIASLSEAVCAALPGRPEPVVTAYGAGLFAFRQTLDISRARKELGWQPRVSFDEGLMRTFAGEAQ